MYNSIHHLTR